MARKKKKQTRKQQIKQRRATKTRDRKKSLSKRPKKQSASNELSKTETALINDMFPLFAKGNAQILDSQEAIEPFMMSILASHKLIDESEFDDIILDPAHCAGAFVEVVETLNIDLAELQTLSTDAQEDTQLEMIEAVTTRLLTSTFRKDIIASLRNLRKRLRREGRLNELAQAAALQMTLTDEDQKKVWPMIGLLQVIVWRSLEISFEFMGATLDLDDLEGTLENANDFGTLQESFMESSAFNKLTSLVNRLPGLKKSLENQVDTIWDEGVNAIGTGELILYIYSEQELFHGFELLAKVMKMHKDDETITEENRTADIKAVFSEVDTYLAEIFTPERFERLKNKISTLMREQSVDKKWTSFLIMVMKELKEDEPLEYLRGFLIGAFMGEIRVKSQEIKEETEDEV